MRAIRTRYRFSSGMFDVARTVPAGRTLLILALLFGSLGGCDDGSRAAVEPDPVGGPALMRRLTETQFRATVADIFGPDVPVSARFERGLRSHGLVAVGTSEAGMSAFSIEQYDAAARSIAAFILSEEQRVKYVPCRPQDDVFDEGCATRFVERYGPRLLRRPLAATDIGRFVDSARRGSAQLGSFHDGLAYALVGVMVSPEFLLRIERPERMPEEPGVWQLDAASRASRLSYFLTNSTPDEELLRAASAGELDAADTLTAQVDRLIASPRFNDAIRAFFGDMLEFELFDDLAKDPAIYPAFNSDVVEDAQEQTLRTITDHLVEQDGDYRDLFTTRTTWLTRALGVVYRLPVAARTGWEKSEFPASSGRAGIHTNISFLALHSHPGRSSPTLRGKAVREIFLCQEVPAPPPKVNFSVVQDSSSTNMPTARDRLQVHRQEPSCAGCHKVMDPVGLTLESFDGLGTHRTRENEALIDTSGDLDGVDFNDTEGLAQALRNHPETPRCLVEKMYRFAVGRDTVWEERPYMDYLVATFAEKGYRVPELMRAIALSRNFFAISSPPDTGPDHVDVALQASSGDRT